MARISVPLEELMSKELECFAPGGCLEHGPHEAVGSVLRAGLAGARCEALRSTQDPSCEAGPARAPAREEYGRRRSVV